MKILKITETLILLLLIAIFISIVLWWRLHEIKLPEPAIAGRDGAGDRKIVSEAVKIGEFFKKFSELSEDEKSAKFPDWANFRGAQKDNIASTSLDLDYNLENAKVLWRIALGEGYSAPVIYKNRVYILDYDEELEADSLRCFSLSDGRELWRRWYSVKVRRNHGKSRTTSAVADDVVVSIGPMGQVMAVDALSGNFLWAKDMPREFGSEVPQWYCGQCPLIDGAELILAPAGKEKLLVGLDLKTGKENWSVQNLDGVKMSHSSAMVFEVLGKKQFLYCAIGGVFGVSAEGADRGKLLWKNTQWKPNVFAPSPVKFAENKIFLTAGYGAGGAILTLEKSEEKWSAKILKTWKPKQGASCEQQTPLVYKNRLFTILPKDAGALNALLASYDTSKDLEFIVSSDRACRFGLGPYMIINDKFFVLDDEGKLYVLNFENDVFLPLSSKKFFEGADSWAPMAFSEGLLILRDSKELACLDIRKANK